MKIVQQADVPYVSKPEGTNVWYYIFPEHEVHYNEILPRTVQTWHHHDQISEGIYVLSGSLSVSWVDGDTERHEYDAPAGTLIQVEQSVHTFANRTNEIVKFIVFRFVPRGDDLHELIKNDKVVDDVD